MFNFADADVKDYKGPVMGKVFIYIEHVTLTQVPPFMSLKHKIMYHFSPIFKKLAL